MASVLHWSLQPGNVVVSDTGDDCSAGVWGKLLSTAARAKGARSAVIDGLTRDAARICAKGFPVYARGISPYDFPVQCGGVTVKSGEIVFADYDGVIVIPQDALASALEFAETKASRERIVDEEFRKGPKVA